MIKKYKKKKFEKWPSHSLKEANDVKKLILKSSLNYWTGDEIKNFEKKFAKYFDLKFALAISNASVGLDIALQALNIKKNDEVIVSPKSYYSSVSCIIKNGAKPVFIDLNVNSQCFDEDKIEEKITNKTKVILCVHLGGFPCNMEKILRIAKKYKLKVVEDCAQAHGAKIEKKFVGSFGDVSIWSFCNDKIISSGEGGIISAKNKNIYKKIWSLKENGRDFDSVYHQKHKFGYKWIHKHIGFNYRMTAMQAVLASYQLKNLKKNINIRNNNYKKLMQNYKKFNGLKFQNIPKNYTNAFYRIYATVNKKYLKKNWDRDKIVLFLNKSNIDCNVGSCSELYREIGIKNNLVGKINLMNASYLSKNSIAFNVHHKYSKDYIVFIYKTLNKLMFNISK